MTRRDILKASALVGAAGLRMETLNAAKVAGTHGFKLGIITDELTTNLDEAADFLTSYGLHWCELREMFTRNIMNSTQDDLDKAKKILDQHKLQVSDIGSPIFKWNLPQVPAKANEK